MKYIHMVMGVACIMSIIMVPCVYGAQWKFYGITQGDDDAYYDQDSIQHLSGGVIRVWEFHILSDETRERLIHTAHTKGIDIRTFDDAVYGVYLTEIHCVKKEYGILYAFLYDKHLSLLGRTASKEKHRSIREETREHELYRAVCLGKGR